MSDDRIPWLDLWQRGGAIYGALGGLRLELLPIENAQPDGPHWRLYVSARLEGVDRDRARPTTATKPAPTGWAGVRERQRLASLGTAMAFYRDELNLEDDE